MPTPTVTPSDSSDVTRTGLVFTAGADVLADVDPDGEAEVGDVDATVVGPPEPPDPVEHEASVSAAAPATNSPINLRSIR
ncbi:MAG: hypothetical protein ABI232_11190 [Jatrophihabitantaceae bacterium]